MKKRFMFLVLATLLLTLGSCKKWYTCTCTNNGNVEWTGQVEGTSKTQVQNTLSGTGGDCAGDVVSCN